MSGEKLDFKAKIIGPDGKELEDVDPSAFESEIKNAKPFVYDNIPRNRRAMEIEKEKRRREKELEESKKGLSKLYEGEERQNKGPIHEENLESLRANTGELKKAVELLKSSKEPWWRKFKFWEK